MYVHCASHEFYSLGGRTISFRNDDSSGHKESELSCGRGDHNCYVSCAPTGNNTGLGLGQIKFVNSLLQTVILSHTKKIIGW